jgi:hypothetical protein
MYNLYYLYPKNNFDQDAAMTALKQTLVEALGTGPETIFLQGLERQAPVNFSTFPRQPAPSPPANWKPTLPSVPSSYLPVPSSVTADLRFGLINANVGSSGKGKDKAVDQDRVSVQVIGATIHPVPETASDEWVALRLVLIFSHASIIDQYPRPRSYVPALSLTPRHSSSAAASEQASPNLEPLDHIHDHMLSELRDQSSRINDPMLSIITWSD